MFQWFRDEVGQQQKESGVSLGSLAEEPLLLLFSHLDPIYEVHSSLLRELEQRMAAW